MSNQDNPYLFAGRLSDVIAAITALANYKYYKLSYKTAADRIAKGSGDVQRWSKVFEQHPEFFRVHLDDKRVSLVWRRQRPRRYHTKEDKVLSRSEYGALTANERENYISRVPLNSDETTALINIAVNLHDRALEKQKADRWMVPIFFGVGTAILAFAGSILGAYLSRGQT